MALHSVIISKQNCIASSFRRIARKKKNIISQQKSQKWYTGFEVKVASSKTPTLECFNPSSFLVVSNVIWYFLYQARIGCLKLFPQKTYRKWESLKEPTKKILDNSLLCPNVIVHD